MEGPPARATRRHQKLRSGQSHRHLLRRNRHETRKSLHLQTQPHPRPNPKAGMAPQLALLHPRPRGQLQDLRGPVREQHADSQAAQRGGL